MYRSVIKRILDIALSLLGLPLLCLVLVIFAPMIYLTDKGPVFYNAPRLGKNGKPFRMVKLRSMSVNAPDLRLGDGSTFNAADDPRVTPVGKFLRKTSLDEAPQLFNVLRGEMSVVGPRPDLPGHLKYYEGNEMQKLTVRPGITGYNQAYFRNTVNWKTRLEHDVYYAGHVSFLFDLRIFLRTAYVVLARRNIYAASKEEQPHD